MHILFAALRLYPFWALPLAFVIVELGIYFRRRGSSLQFGCWSSAGFFGLTALCWVIFRGDVNSDTWVRYVVGG